MRDSPSGATLTLDPPPLLPLTGPSRGSGLSRVRYRILVGARRLLERWVSAAVGSCCAGLATHIYTNLCFPPHCILGRSTILDFPPQYIKKQNEQTPTSRSKGIFNNENPNQSIIDQLLTTGFLVGRFGAAHRYGSARRLQALSTRLTVCGRGVCPQERLFFGGEPPLPAEQSRLLPPL